MCENGIIKRTGLFDKDGYEICLGDTIEINTPYRETQTHYGENIPSPCGSYTEPLEPEIKTERFVVKWGKGMFFIKTEVIDDAGEMIMPLSWELFQYTRRDELIDAFGGLHKLWVEEGSQGDDDLGYLLSEYPPNTEQELMEFVSGCKIIEQVKQ